MLYRALTVALSSINLATMIKIYITLIASLTALMTFGQQAHSQSFNSKDDSGTDVITPTIGCGSYGYMKHLEKQQPGYIQEANESLKKLVNRSAKSQKTANAVIKVPVVFHVLFNEESKNLPDSVIYNQLRVLNEAFRRRNPDTITMRSDFAGLVGDTKIEFELATIDPFGNPTTGITRTNSQVTHFGGVLPFEPNDTSGIINWYDDSLFYNLLRITNSNLGGKTAWNINRYFNIWIGDLRVFQPKNDNFEELSVLGFATPPPTHPSWQGTGVDDVLNTQGAVLHYTCIGPNNPRLFPPPYGWLDGLVNQGDILVHEAGHYLGLRHIWGDGDCSADDFISDTPLASASGGFACNKQKNSCIDSINGLDLPDMVENFMDYSPDDCNNSFTKGQTAVMQEVLIDYRPNVRPGAFASNQEIKIFPNPTRNQIAIGYGRPFDEIVVRVFMLDGQLVSEHVFQSQEELVLDLVGPQGIYLVQIQVENTVEVFKILKI